jgi:hypothetical protein
MDEQSGFADALPSQAADEGSAAVAALLGLQNLRFSG